MTLRREDVARRHDLDPRRGSGTFRRRDNAAGTVYADFPLVHLGPRNPSATLAMGDVSADQETGTFCVWAHEIGNVEPKDGDLIVDADGDTWVVRAVDSLLMATRFHCHCVRLL